MDVFELRNRLVEDYASYTRSFIKISDERIREKVDAALNEGALWARRAGGRPERHSELGVGCAAGGTTWLLYYRSRELTGSSLLCYGQRRRGGFTAN
jgi:hypothetical protein